MNNQPNEHVTVAVWSSQASETWHCAVWYNYADVSEEPSALEAKRKHRRHQTMVITRL